MLVSAALAERSGERVGESVALHDLARLGQAGKAAPRLRELAQTSDPVALEEVSGTFEEMGACCSPPRRRPTRRWRHTVQNNLHAAYEKLGVEGRAELAQALEGY